MRRVAFVALLALLAPAAPARAQSSTPEDQARRLLEEGRAYWEQGKIKQALDDFNTVVSGYPNTSAVATALLEIGRYWAEAGSDPAKAREYFEQVTKRYPQSDGAPGAYYQLGMLTLAGAAGQAELDDAQAQFLRVVRLYPRSDWVPRALYAVGLVNRRAGKLAEAADAERRVTFEHPASDIAPAAQYQLGQLLALLGDHAAAMEEFQRLRNRWPQHPLAAQALDRNTALYRLYGGPRPAFVVDGSYAVGAGEVMKSVRALAMDPGRTLWVASEKVNAVAPFGPDGRVGASLPGQDLRSLSLGPRGEVVVAARLAVRIGSKDVRSLTVPSDKPGVPEPLEHITAAVLLPGGGLLVADDKQKRVYRFDAASKFVGPFPDARPRQIDRMVSDSEGAVIMLDRDARTVSVHDRGGALLRTLGPTGPGFTFRKLADVAVDPFRNLYVADEEAGVFVISPAGQHLATLSGEEIRKPRAVTVDPAGAVLVYDDKTERVVRFR